MFAGQTLLLIKILLVNVSVCISRNFLRHKCYGGRQYFHYFASIKGNVFIFSPILMRHGAVYAAYRALSPVFYRSLISGLVSSNASTNCSQNQVLTMLQQAAILIFLIFSLISVHVYPNLPMNNTFVVHNADSFASKTLIF